MTSYGFRLFQVSVRRGNTRKDHPFVKTDDKSTWRYSDYVCALLQKRKGIRERGLPQPPRPEDEADVGNQRAKPLFSIEEIGSIGEYVAFTVSFGAQSGHKMALADPDDFNAEDLDISGHYPSRRYRGVLILPESGEIGILALEVISRACPRQPFVRWLSQWSKAEALPDDAGDTPPWWRLIANPLVDEQTLAKFIERAAAETIYLTRHRTTDDRKREVDELDLKVEIARESLRTGVLNNVRAWYRAIRTGQKITDQEAAKAVAALVGDELDHLDFDETEISLLDTQTGRQKKVSPSRLPDVFVYPLSEDTPPELSVLYASIRSAVERIQPTLSASLNWEGWPLPKE